MNTFKKFGLLTITLASLTGVGTYARAESDKDDDDQPANTQNGISVLEGELIKTKKSENEIYVRTAQGKREEVSLKAPFEIVRGTEKLEFSALKKGMKVRITARNKVEVLN